MFKLPELTEEDIENMKKYLEQWNKETEENIKFVSSDNYKNWIYDFIETLEHKRFTADEFDYEEDSVNKANSSMLGYFIQHIQNLAETQNILKHIDQENYFENYGFFIKIKNNYYYIWQMYGQGTATIIEKIEKPQNDYVEVKING